MTVSKMCELCKEVDLPNKRKKYCEECAKARKLEVNKEYRQRQRVSINSEEIRLCGRCEEVEIGSNRKTKYCSKCAAIIRKENEKLANDKNNKIKNKEQYVRNRKRLDENFKLLNLQGIHLIPKNFNAISSISNRAYVKHFNTNWFDVLKHYEVDSSLMDAIKIGFVGYIERTGTKNVITFAREEGFYSSFFLENMNLDEIREYAGIRNMRNTSLNDLQENFYKVVTETGRLPYTTKEFTEASNVTIATYMTKLPTSSQPHLQQVERIVKNYTTETEFQVYLENREIHFAEKYAREGEARIGKFMYSKEEMLSRVEDVIEDYVTIHGSMPSATYIEITGKLSFSSFKSRFNMSSLDVLEELGYEVEDTSTETAVINSISEILKESSVRQATFDWLRSDGGRVLQCDAYYPKHKLVVEYDGQQHFYPVDFAGEGEDWAKDKFARTQFLDSIKNTNIPKNNLTLFRIAYDEPYTDRDFLRSRLLESGITPPNHTVIYGSESQQNISSIAD